MMSLFSRFFRKAPSPPTAAPEAPAKPAENPQPARIVTDRAAVAAREEQTLRAAIERNDVDTIARLVAEGASTRVRQLAAQAVEDPARLRELIRQVRGGKDKSVYKILTARRDVLLAESRRVEQLQAEVSAVVAAIERHSRRPYDPLFGPTLDQLEIRWKVVAGNAEPAVAQSVHEAIDRSREVIAQHLRQIAVEASRQLAAANAAAEAQRLRELEEKANAEAAAERDRIQAEQRRAQAEKQEAEALALRQLGGLVRKALSALNEGSTGRAAGLRRAIEEKLAGIAPLPAYLVNQVTLLDTKLNELKDWKSFSVAPKRAELMEEMESLAGCTLDPPTLADRIKGLQEEWRTLSKGAGENLEADWQRFQAAAQQAYQPCREYFEAQSLLRQENLQRREALLARLEEFESGHNWEQPNWRLVMRASRESKQEWRRHAPVDRAAGKRLQERFSAVTARLQGRLDAEYAANIQQKRQLIEHAQRLQTGEDSRKSIDDVRELQHRWKSVGPVPRDEDNRLWEEFRLHCDAVFQKRQQEFAEYTSALDTNASQAVALCEEVERVAALTGAQLLEGANGLAERRGAFEAIGEFPRGVARELRNRFELALERCEESAARQKARDAERSWIDLLDAADRVRAFRLALARNTEPAQLDVLRQAAQDHIAAVPHWPKGGLEAIKNQLAGTDGADIDGNEKALRMLCIRAEVLAERPTPSEDQQLRREYQVQRLIRSMGQGVTADESRLDTLALEWIRVGPTEEGVYRTLLERFMRCRDSL